MKKKNKFIKIIYFGNKFSSYKSSTAVMETLEPLLSDFVDVKSYSSKQGKLAKLFDMVLHFFSQGIFSNKIIIDVYSTSAFYFAWILGFLSFLFNKKYILFLHGGNLPNRYKTNPKLTSFLFRKSHKIIAPSHYLKSFFEKYNFDVQYIPNIIELADYQFKERKNIKPKLLALRGFGKPYNPIMTLKAVNELRQEIPEVELLMLGNPDEYYYNQVIDYINKYKLKSSVTVLNKMPKQDWIKLSEEYDIMISNPVIDNTPVSIIEGMALGMCVISTKVGGVPFLVDENEVVLVESNNEKQLVSEVKSILKDNNLANTLSLNARKKAETFAWENVKQSWKNILLN
ncbi:MAG: glycosyltransferase family 4 protein [Flavobacteriales bacterium]|nr:glycosyltransferase family 4 protein [Flavobacteriales bacterium]